MDLITLAAGNWWYEFWNSMWLLVCQGIYFFVSALYQVYEKVASVNLFSREIFEEITGRLYIVIGVAMLFIFAYNLILMIINPEDKKGTSNMTKVVKETIMSLVLVILLPTIFNYLYVFQTHILESNIIGNIVLGNVGSTSANSENCDPTDYDCSCDFSSYKLDRYKGTVNYRILFWTVYSSVSNTNRNETEILSSECKRYKEELTGSQRGAYSIASTVFSAFYRPANFTFDECVTYLQTDGGPVASLTEEDRQICVNFFYDVTLSKYLGNTWGFTSDTYLKDIISDSSKNTMEFHWIMAVVAGVLAVYMFFCYAMEIGVRVAKLGFLQLISPIPVMIKIIPEQKKVYDAWFKNLTKTYVDVFIRVAIIDFALFGISLVPDVISTMWTSTTTGDGNFFIKTLAIVFVILGILKFAQDAPALFKEFFGDAGTFKLRSPKQQLTDNKLAMKGLGAITGAVGAGTAGAVRNYTKTSNFDEDGNRIEGTGSVKSAIGGALGGVVRGGYSGYKNGVDKSGQTISDTADVLDANREKHKATRTAINDAGGIIPYMKDNLGDKWSDFSDFMTGNVASPELGNAANGIMVQIDNIENDFKNANIKNIEAGRAEIMKNFNADKDFDFNGKHYQKVDDNHWNDGTRKDIKHGDLGKEIVDAFKDRIADAYGQNEAKDGFFDGFKRSNEQLLKELKDSMPKLGESFNKSLWEKLNDMQDVTEGLLDINGNPIDLNVDSLDALEDRMNKLMYTRNDEGKIIANKDGLAAIYKINDEIKSLAKGIKISNDQALKAQQAAKEKKDK